MGWRVLLLAGAALIPAAGWPGPAIAQSAPAAARTAFDIRPQPLSQALVQFSNATGVQLFFSADLVRGRSSAGLQGSFTAAEALARLLAGSGLTYRFEGANAVTLMPAPAASAEPGILQVPTVEVEATAPGQGFGPTNGFIARDAIAGTKTDTPIIETPASVSVIPRSQLDAQNPQSLPDALRYTPGVATGFFGADNRMLGGQIYLRGFGDDPSTLYWNGLALSGDSYVDSPLIDPYLLERIEILRGPASVLYGQASPGGIVNAWSRRPTETPVHEIILGTGNYGRAYGALDLGGPITQDGTWLYRLTGVAYRTGTQIDDTAYERIAIAPALTWRPTADTRLTLLASYQRDPDGVGFQSLPLEGTLLPSRTGRIPTSRNFGEPGYDRLDRTTASIGYAFEHRFSDALLVRQNFRYLHAEGTYREVQPDGWADATHTLVDRWNWATRGRMNTINLDNQVQLRFATGPVTHTVLAGLDYRGQWTALQHFWTRNGVPQLNVLNPVYGLPIPAASAIAHTRGTLEQTGIYIQDQIAFGNWRLLLGARQDWATVTSTNLRATGTPRTSQDSHAFTGRVGLVYLFDSGFAPYASYSTSFQPQGGTDFGGNMFQPTTARQYEIGIRYQPPGMRSLLQAAVFDLTQQNVLTTDPLHTGFSVQTGEVRARGVELSATLALSSNLNLTASYTYNALETTRANPDASGFNATGRVPWYYPRQLASLWGDYTIRDGTMSGLRLGGGIRYVGSAYNGPREANTVPSYTLVDAVIGYDLGEALPALRGLDLSVTVNNLFDKQYLARCSEINCSWGIRRTVLANLRYRW